MQKTNFWFVVMMIVSTVTNATIIDVPGDYSTIQAGLNIAVQGDTVLVQPGTYVENIIWPGANGIKLFSAGDSSNTIIDGSYFNGVIYISGIGNTDTTTVIRGFRITHGYTSGLGGGIYCSRSNLSLENCTITANSAYDEGGGISCYFTNVTIENCTITNNSVSGQGGGIANYDSNLTIEDCIISANLSSDYGGGIYCNVSNASVQNCTIEGNSAVHGGGIICMSGNVIIESCIIRGNSTTMGDGGAIWCWYSSLTAVEVLLDSNFASGYGGGVYCCDNTSPSFEHCTVSRNMAGIEGDGIYTTNNSWPTISRCNIFQNGMGIYNSDSTQILNCPNNWWGDPSGPYHPTLNPYGLGDSTNAYVNPMPFLTEPDSLAPPAAVSEHHFQPPTAFRLFPNYPNPFNATTTIVFELPVISKVTLDVYNILGQVVATIIDDKMLSSGCHDVTFSDTNLSSGVYFYQLTADRNTAIGKMVLLK